MFENDDGRTDTGVIGIPMKNTAGDKKHAKLPRGQRVKNVTRIQNDFADIVTG